VPGQGAGAGEAAEAELACGLRHGARRLARGGGARGKRGRSYDGERGERAAGGVRI
jgi:hypothetical protein